MNATERKQVLDQFAFSEVQLLGLVEGLTPEQWTFQTAPDRWSIAGIIEHVINVETRLTRAIGKMSGQPSESGEKSLVADADLWRKVGNRSTRLEAPPAVQPAGKFTDMGELVNEFRATRARTVEFVSTTNGNLRGALIPHMAFGEIDLYQWLIVLSMHGTRHAQQIEEIKAHPGFPR